MHDARRVWIPTSFGDFFFTTLESRALTTLKLCGAAVILTPRRRSCRSKNAVRQVKPVTIRSVQVQDPRSLRSSWLERIIWLSDLCNFVSTDSHQHSWTLILLIGVVNIDIIDWSGYTIEHVTFSLGKEKGKARYFWASSLPTSIALYTSWPVLCLTQGAYLVKPSVIYRVTFRKTVATVVQLVLVDLHKLSGRLTTLQGKKKQKKWRGSSRTASRCRGQ